MTRLGLFGGTFDPVHYGHLRPVEAARVELGLDRVWLLPNPRPPHKPGQSLTEYVHRKEMLRLALPEFPHLEISDEEEQADGPAYTIDTVRRIIANASDDPLELCLIIGADSFLELPRWKNPEELLGIVSIAVLPRPGFMLRPETPLRSRVHELKTPLVDISATDLRSRLKTGENPRGLLPESVIAYIRHHKLYQE